jgi:outer membrane protein assembly factor BamB/DNA-binding winged helix-turn-helix (wHTH) protein
MTPFRLFEVEVWPALNEIRHQDRSERLPSKFIDVLAVLAEQADTVVGKPELLRRVWGGALVGDEALSHAVWVLRRSLGDDARRPRFIQTVPRRGYRLIAPVCPISTEAAPPHPLAESTPTQPVPSAALLPKADTSTAGGRPARSFAWPSLAALLILTGMLALLFGSSSPAPAPAATTLWRIGDRLNQMQRLADGRILLARGDGELLVWAPDAAQPDWRRRLGVAVAAPIGIHDGRLLVPGEDGFLYHLAAADGSERGRFMAAAPLRASPWVDHDGIVLAGDHGEVLRLSADGKEVRWRAEVGGRLRARALRVGSSVLVADLDGRISALALADGQLRWHYSLGHAINVLQRLPAAIDGAEVDVLALSESGRIARLGGQDGAVRWLGELGDACGEPLPVEDAVFVLNRQGDASLLDLASGQPRWRARWPIAGMQQPIATRNGIAVLLDGGRIGVVEPNSGHLQQVIASGAAIDRLLDLGDRLALARLDGDVQTLALPPRGEQGFWRLQDDGSLQLEVPRSPAAAPSPAHIEALQDGPLPQLLGSFDARGRPQEIALLAEGGVVVAEANGVRRFSAEGAPLWQFSLDQPPGTRLVVDGERLWFGGNDGTLYSLDLADGRQHWQFDSGARIRSSPVRVGERVLFASVAGDIFSLDAEAGTVIWRHSLGAPVHAEMAVSAGRMFVGAGDGQLHVLASESGQELWRAEIGDWVVAAPLLLGERVYVGSADGRLLALANQDGRRLWQFSSGARIWFGLVAEDGAVYFASGDGHVYAVDAISGRERWRQRVGPHAEGRLALSNGRVLAGSPEGYLYAFDGNSGRVLWRLRTGGAALNPATRPPWLAVGSADQRIHLLRDP